MSLAAIFNITQVDEECHNPRPGLVVTIGPALVLMCSVVLSHIVAEHLHRPELILIISTSTYTLEDVHSLTDLE